MEANVDGLIESPAVSVKRLIRRFGRRAVLDGLDLEIQKGEFVSLLGRSGSGKSTLLRALAGLDHSVDGSGHLWAPNMLSVVFQDARLLPWKTVLDNVVFGLQSKDRRRRGRNALAEVELAGREAAWPFELSGGEQQRVALARSLVREPELLLADEPFGALDSLTRIRMHALLRRLCEQHRPAVLLVTHDVDEAISLSDRIVILENGRIAQDLNVEPPGSSLHFELYHKELRAFLLKSLGVHTDFDLQRSPMFQA